MSLDTTLATLKSISIVDNIISPISSAMLRYSLNGEKSGTNPYFYFRDLSGTDKTIAFYDPSSPNIGYAANAEDYWLLKTGSYELSFVVVSDPTTSFDKTTVYYGGKYYNSGGGAINPIFQYTSKDSTLSNAYTGVNHNFNFESTVIKVYNDSANPTPLLKSISANVSSGVLAISYDATLTSNTGEVTFYIEPVSERGLSNGQVVNKHSLVVTSSNATGQLTKAIPKDFPEGNYVITAFVSSQSFLTEGAITTTYNSTDWDAWVAKYSNGKAVTLYNDTYTLSPSSFQFSYKAQNIPIISTETHSLSLIVDKGILGASAVVLNGLNETMVFKDGILTNHTLNYGGATFSYDSIDTVIMTVARDGDFTSEFRKELTELLPASSSLSYKDVVKLVGLANIDSVIHYAAGSDGNYVG